MWNIAKSKSSRARLWLLAACIFMLAGTMPPAAIAQDPPDQIVFSSYAIDTDGDGLVSSMDNAVIFVVNPDGSGLTQITDGSTLDRGPVWSAQGDRIAFLARTDANNDGIIDVSDNTGLVVINADGTGRLPLVSDTLNVKTPLWDPTGARIAFTDHPDSNDDGIINDADPTAIWIVDAIGGGLSRISPEGIDANDPTWSPDGLRLAYSGLADTNGDGSINKAAGDTASLYVAQLNKNEETGVTEVVDIVQVTEDASYDVQPQFSPDGTQLAYMSFRHDHTMDGLVNPADIPSITVIDADGRNRKPLTDEEFIDYEPRWSPDGSVIAFRSFRFDSDGDGTVTTGDYAGIYKVSARGGNLVRLSDPNAAAQRPPTWSPDGTRLAYESSADANGDGIPDPPNIFIADATIVAGDDPRVTLISSPNAIDLEANWSRPGAPPVAAPPPTEAAAATEPPTEAPPTEAAIAATEPPTEAPPTIEVLPTEAPSIATATFVIMTAAPPTEEPAQAPATEAPTIAPTVAPTTPTPTPTEAEPTAAPTIEAVAVEPTATIEAVAVEPTATIAEPVATEAPTLPPQPAGPMRLTYHSRNADTTGDGAIDARDTHSIITVLVDGSDTQQLSGAASSDKNPVWSPDLQWIAYVGLADSNGDGVISPSDCSGIYVAAADGGSINRITPEGMFAAGPAWSPDGHQLAFYGTTIDTDDDGYLTARDNTNIYLINYDGSGMVQVTLDRAADFAPDFSPDGSKLAFASRAADTSGDGLIGIYDNASIFIVGVDGSNLTQITVNATEDQMPSWSPEGRRLVFVSWTSDNNLDGYIGTDHDIPGIFVIESNGANLARLTDPGAYAIYPAWNPDGTRIAYVVRQDTDADGQMRYNDAGHLFITDGSGNLTAQLTDNTFGTLRPAWSPDGSLIAFHSWIDINGDGVIKYPDMPSIFTITTDDATRTQISDNASADFDPVWAPAGAISGNE